MQVHIPEIHDELVLTAEWRPRIFKSKVSHNFIEFLGLRFPRGKTPPVVSVKQYQMDTPYLQVSLPIGTRLRMMECQVVERNTYPNYVIWRLEKHPTILRRGKIKNPEFCTLIADANELRFKCG